MCSRPAALGARTRTGQSLRSALKSRCCPFGGPPDGARNVKAPFHSRRRDGTGFSTECVTRESLTAPLPACESPPRLALTRLICRCLYRRPFTNTPRKYGVVVAAPPALVVVLADLGAVEQIAAQIEPPELAHGPLGSPLRQGAPDASVDSLLVACDDVALLPWNGVGCRRRARRTCASPWQKKLARACVN